MVPKKKYIIGSRGSLLALTQTNSIRQELIKATGLEFEIEVIKTQGDLQTEKPLWQLKGENFFTRELDEALINKKVDLVVHSFKDLGGTRPEEIALAAVPKRSFPNDILLIKKDTLAKLPEMTKFVIGTSSPRRIYLSHKLLPKLLPFGKRLTIETTLLRGNVNTRLQKLVNGDFDAILLALAGLERLSSSSESLEEIKKLVHDLDFMLMPVSEFTPAAAQGALAIECLKSNSELLEKIQLISDEASRQEALREKFLFSHYGGGCHQAVGVHVRSHPLGQVEIHRGEKEGTIISRTLFQTQRAKPLHKVSQVFIGLPSSKASLDDIIYDEISLKEYIRHSPNPNDGHFLVTSNHCISMLKKVYQSGTIWSAGIKTMMTLAQENIWVNGCADFTGAREIETFAKSNFLNLLLDRELPWQVLTAEGSHSTFAKTISCYKRSWKKPNIAYRQKIEACSVFYWTSFPQYQAFLQEFPHVQNATHACGLGKTYDEFSKNNIAVTPFASIEEFKEWFYEQAK